MATYYLQLNGNDANTGLGPAAGQAWRTFRRAVNATGVGSGDTLYIAPGDYRDTSGTIPLDGTYSTTTSIIGNPSGSQFTGISSGRILITSRGNSDVSAVGGPTNTISITNKSNLIFENLMFENTSVNGTVMLLTNCTDLVFKKCIWMGTAYQNSVNVFAQATGAYILASRNYLFTRCMFRGGGGAFQDNTSYAATGTNYNYNITLDRCINMDVNLTTGGVVGPSGIYMVNCDGCSISAYNSKGNIIAKNSTNIYSSNKFNQFFIITQGANTVSTGNAIENCAYLTTNSYTFTSYGVGYIAPSNLHSVSENRLFGINPNYERSGYGVYLENQGTLTGTAVIPTLAGLPGYSATGVPTTDIYGNPWSGNGTPHIGAYNDYSLTATGFYNPTERNSSAITIVPGSTSQSIELYLGVTGLTASTAGLSATYNRTRSNRVPITLVNLTYMTDGWVSGGFKEVDASTMPGVYRLDLPDAAVAVGADDVTVVVKGAAGTNGAVMTIKLLSVASDILSADIGGGTNAGTLNERTVRSALRAMRNKVAVGTGTMSVYKEDDSAVAWTGSLSNTADVTVDPV